MFVGVNEDGYGYLPETGGAVNLRRVFLRSCESRQKQRCQKGDDGNDDEQLDEREAGRFAPHMFQLRRTLAEVDAKTVKDLSGEIDPLRQFITARQLHLFSFTAKAIHSDSCFFKANSEEGSVNGPARDAGGGLAGCFAQLADLQIGLAPIAASFSHPISFCAIGSSHRPDRGAHICQSRVRRWINDDSEFPLPACDTQDVISLLIGLRCGFVSCLKLTGRPLQSGERLVLAAGDAAMDQSRCSWQSDCYFNWRIDRGVATGAIVPGLT